MLIFSLFKLWMWRRRLKSRQWKAKGLCRNCGKFDKHEAWCWGPKIRLYLKAALKTKFRTIKFIYRLFKTEVRWAGVEPWHRYE